MLPTLRLDRPRWEGVEDGVVAAQRCRTRRADFALFMVAALTDDTLVHEAPAIVGRLSPSALAHHPHPEGAR